MRGEQTKGVSQVEVRELRPNSGFIMDGSDGKKRTCILVKNAGYHGFCLETAEVILLQPNQQVLPAVIAWTADAGHPCD